MKEAINKFFVEDGNIDPINDFKDDGKNEEIIYEVVRVIKGVPLFLESHLERMKDSFGLVNREFPFSNNKIEEYIESLINSNKIDEGNIKITFNTENDTMKLFFIKHKYPTKDMYDNGVKAIIYKGERENPNAKIIKKDFRDKINKSLKENRAYEALLEDYDGYITEGSRSNIFYIKNNKIVTPPNNKVLKGVTRKKILEIAKDKNIEVEEILLNKKQLLEVDSIFMSGTSPKVLPISKIENKNFDTNNLVLKEIMEEYDKRIEKYISGNK